MPISVTCQNCSRQLSAPDSAAGQRTKCPTCRTTILVPVSPDAPTTPAPVLAQPVMRVIACPHCQGNLGVDLRQAGQSMVCPTCQRQFRIPGESAKPSSPPATAEQPLPSTSKARTASRPNGHPFRESDQQGQARSNTGVAGRKRSPLALTLGVGLFGLVILFVVWIFGFGFMKSPAPNSSEIPSDQQEAKQAEKLKKAIAEGDKQLKAGKKEDAVANYKEGFSVAGNRKAELAKLIVEFEIECNKIPEAKKWIERALEENLQLNYDNAGARALLGIVQQEREERAAKRKAEEEELAEKRRKEEDQRQEEEQKLAAQRRQEEADRVVQSRKEEMDYQRMEEEHRKSLAAFNKGLAELRKKHAAEDAARPLEGEHNANGLVLVWNTVKVKRGALGFEITGTVENRRPKTLRYAEIKFIIYDESEAQVGTALANITDLESGARWNFRAVDLATKGTKYNYRLSELSGY